jgi:ribonuclease BN (tRNA processing enzyme)
LFGVWTAGYDARMSFSLTVLGSGTSVPCATRMAPAHLVRAGELALLVDCGSGCTTGLARAGLTLDRLSGVLLTHLHPDHTADLLPLLFALSNPMGPQRAGELPIWGPPGTARLLEQLGATYGRWVKPRGGELRVVELGDGAVVDLADLRVLAFEVVHLKGSLALRFEHGGRALCASGDSGPCPGLERAARGVDLFLCECAALEGDGYRLHMNATDVGRCATAAGARAVVLTHLYDHIVAADPIARVRELYAGPVQLAEDGLRIDLE